MMELCFRTKSDLTAAASAQTDRSVGFLLQSIGRVQVYSCTQVGQLPPTKVFDGGQVWNVRFLTRISLCTLEDGDLWISDKLHPPVLLL